MYRKRKKSVIALLSAALLFSGCAQTIGHNGQLPTVQDGQTETGEPLSSEGEQLPAVSGGTADTAETGEQSAVVEQGSCLIEDGGTLNVLVSRKSNVDYAAAAASFREMGGKVSISYCDEDELFDRISAEKLADKRVDIASFDNGLMYPYGVSKDMLEPLDTVLNMNSSRWNSIRTSADMFRIGGWHYVLPLNVSMAYAMYYYPEEVISVTGIDPAECVEKGEWTLDVFGKMLEKWYTDGGVIGLAGEYGTPMYLSTGSTVIGYDSETSGFFNNSYDTKLADIANKLYSYKSNSYIYENSFNNVYEALDINVMFYADGFAIPERSEAAIEIGANSENAEPPELAAVPFPTKDGTIKYYQARIDGAVIVKGLEYPEAARCFLECAADVASPELEGEFADAFTPPLSAIPVYPYGYGIAPKISSDASKPDDGFPHAAIPLMYSAPYYTGTWVSVCSYFSRSITTELSKLNNKLASQINKD